MPSTLRIEASDYEAKLDNFDTKQDMHQVV